MRPQVDLEAPKKITGIITQGAKDFGSVQFVTAFKVAHSDDGRAWTTVKDETTGTDKVRANTWRVTTRSPHLEAVMSLVLMMSSSPACGTRKLRCLNTVLLLDPIKGAGVGLLSQQLVKRRGVMSF